MLDGVATAFQLGEMMLQLGALLLELDLQTLELGTLVFNVLALAIDVLTLAIDLVLACGEMLSAVGPGGGPMLIGFHGAGLSGAPLRSLFGQLGGGLGQGCPVGGQRCFLSGQQRLLVLKRIAPAFEGRPLVGQQGLLFEQVGLFLGEFGASRRQLLLLASEGRLLNCQSFSLGCQSSADGFRVGLLGGECRTRIGPEGLFSSQGSPLLGQGGLLGRECRLFGGERFQGFGVLRREGQHLRHALPQLADLGNQKFGAAPCGK